jgi:hypothetical protein
LNGYFDLNHLQTAAENHKNLVAHINNSSTLHLQ